MKGRNGYRTKSYKNGDPYKVRMIEALEKCLGVVSTACKAADIDRRTHYVWMNKDKSYSEKVAEITEQVKDVAESALYRKIEKGDTASIIFFLKTRAKDRGYVEKQEHDITTGGEKLPAIAVNLNPPEEKDV